MNILVTLDSNYIKPLKTMLISLFLNNPEDVFTIFLMHSRLNDEELEEIKSFVEANDQLREDITEHVIRPVLPEKMIDGWTDYFINPTGRFVIGGPAGDTGLGLTGITEHHTLVARTAQVYYLHSA